MAETSGSGPSSTLPDLPGYSGLTIIGQGGFSTVYGAREDAFDRDVAIKILDVGNVSDDDLQRFERECKAVGSLSGHPNIVTVYGAGSTNTGRPYIVMELAPRGSLSARMRRDGPMEAHDAVHAGLELVDAVAAAHEIGIVHRDIKPDNVLISRYGRLQLGDFGISSIPGGYETVAGSVAATMGFAAPEVIDGDRATPSSDIYSLAATIASILLGESVFLRRKDEQLVSFINRVITEPPKDLVPYGASPELSAVLHKGMAKQASQRFATADDFRAALTAVPESGIISSVPGAAKAVPASPPPAKPSSHRAQAANPTRRSNRSTPVAQDKARDDLTVARPPKARPGPPPPPVVDPAAPPAESAPPATPVVEPALTVAPVAPVVEPALAGEPAAPAGPRAPIPLSSNRSVEPNRRRGLLVFGAVAGVAVVAAVGIALAVGGGGGNAHPKAAAVTSPKPSVSPSAPVMGAPSATAACTGLTCTFTVSSTVTQGNTLAWSFGDGMTATTTALTTTHDYAAAGTFTATVAASASGSTSKAGQIAVVIASSARAVTLHATPGSTSISGSVTGPDSCLTGNYELQKQGSGWQKVSTGPVARSLRLTAPSVGNYRVVLTQDGITGGVCSSATSSAVSVTAPVAPAPTYAPAPTHAPIHLPSSISVYTPPPPK